MRAGLAPASGSVVGGFRLDRWLGGGEDTEVWRADGDGIVVALKLLRDPADVFAGARMAREAAALRRVRHDHVIALFAAGEEDGEQYVATPLLEAGTLAMLLDEGRLDERTAAAILAPVASALATAHAAGVVHRDVKPANVMLTDHGPLLIDFGAAALDGATLDGWIDGAAALVATTAYAAPEFDVGGAVDVWALGVMLHEAVTGRTDVRAATSALDGVAAETRALIDACCAARPEARPGAAVVAERLHALAGDAVVPSIAPPVVLPVSRARSAGAVDTRAPETRHGRELEIAQLLDLLDAAQATEELRGILVTAPPGMGKSWLLDVAAARAAVGGATVLRAACTEAVNDLRVLASWVRRVGDRARRVELAGAHRADLVAHVTGLESGGSVAADPATIADAFAALIGSCTWPVAIVDDLHHASDDLLELLGRLAYRARIAGALWLGARPGFVDADDLDVPTLALGPLPDEVIIDLAGAHAVELAGGNPLLARELALADAQAGVAGAGSAPGADVRLLIGERLTRLGPAVAGELQLAATCGEVFWPETIGVTSALGMMCRTGLVRLRPDSTIPGSTEAEWAHPLLREVAYERLDTAVRRAAHVTVAHRLDDAATEPEVVAHHAAVAFELGATGESGFVGAVSARAARVALDRFALASADRWTALVRQAGHEPAPGTADTLEAELLLRRGAFARSGELAERWTGRRDDVGTHALAVSAEAHLATGDYDTAERAAAAALARLPDSRWHDQLTSTYVELLKRRGDYEQAAGLAAAASERARARDDRIMATRLELLRAVNATYIANRTGTSVIPHVRAAEAAARELDALGDKRAVFEGALETANVLVIADPLRTLDLVTRAIEMAKELDTTTRVAALATLAAEILLELDRGADALEWMDIAARYPIDESDRLYLEGMRYTTEIAMGSSGDERLHDLDAIANSRAAGYSTRLYPVEVRLWFGRIGDLDLPSLDDPHVAHVVARLSCAAVAGPPWRIPVDDLPIGAANDAALIHYLAGEYDEADELLRRRWAYLQQSGVTHERYNYNYPGPLVMALGPPDVQPRTDWLVDEIVRSAFPRRWAVHRAACALLLAERGHERSAELVPAALALVADAQPDEQVRTWLVPRLTRLYGRV